MKECHHTPCGASVASTAMAVFVPVILWTVFIVTTELTANQGVVEDFGGLAAILLLIFLISVPVHLVCHGIFSCILFRMFFGVPRSVIWYLPVSLIVGATLGTLTCGLLCEKNSFMVFGVSYGLVSGLSAWYFRPEKS